MPRATDAKATNPGEMHWKMNGDRVDVSVMVLQVVRGERGPKLWTMVA